MATTKFVSDIVRWLRIVVVGVCSASLTVFVFLNSFETLFNTDIPFIHALDTWQAKNMLEGIMGGENLQGSLMITPQNIGNFGSPQMIKIPSLNAKLALIPALHVNNQWLYRANNGQYIITSPPKKGNVGDMIVYASVSWRTVPNPEELKVGDNLFVDTDMGWRYMFRITNKNILHISDRYVRSETPLSSIVVLFEDEETKTVSVVQGVFVNIQSVQR